MKSLLIVDDNEQIREIIRDEFSDRNIHIFEAEKGRVAFNLVQNNLIDIIISDIRMPNGDGVELLNNINKIDQNRPKVILMTGFAEIKNEDAIKKGCYAYLKKPISWDELITIIDNALKER